MKLKQLSFVGLCIKYWDGMPRSSVEKRHTKDIELLYTRSIVDTQRTHRSTGLEHRERDDELRYFHRIQHQVISSTLLSSYDETVAQKYACFGKMTEW